MELRGDVVVATVLTVFTAIYFAKFWNRKHSREPQASGESGNVKSSRPVERAAEAMKPSAATYSRPEATSSEPTVPSTSHFETVKESHHDSVPNPPTAHLQEQFEAMQQLQELIGLVYQKLAGNEQSKRYALSSIITTAASALHAEAVTLFTVDPAAHSLRLAVSNRPAPFGAAVPLDEGLVGMVASTGRSIALDDPPAHANFSSVVDEQPGVLTRSLMCYPVIDDLHNVVAVFQVINKRRITRTGPDGLLSATPCPPSGAAQASPPLDGSGAPRSHVVPFDAFDAKLLGNLAAITGAVLQKIKLFSDFKSAQINNSAMLALTKALAAEVDVDNIVLLLVAGLQRMLGNGTVNIFLCDYKHHQVQLSQSFRSKRSLRKMADTEAPDNILLYQPHLAQQDAVDTAGCGPHGPAVRSAQFSIQSGIVGYVARTGSSVVLERASDHPLYDPHVDACNVDRPIDLFVPAPFSPVSQTQQVPRRRPPSPPMRGLHRAHSSYAATGIGGVEGSSRGPLTPEQPVISGIGGAATRSHGALSGSPLTDLSGARAGGGGDSTARAEGRDASPFVAARSKVAGLLGSSKTGFYRPLQAAGCAQSMIVCPVRDQEGRIIAVIQILNKVQRMDANVPTLAQGNFGVGLQRLRASEHRLNSASSRKLGTRVQRPRRRSAAQRTRSLGRGLSNADGVVGLQRLQTEDVAEPKATVSGPVPSPVQGNTSIGNISGVSSFAAAFDSSGLIAHRMLGSPVSDLDDRGSPHCAAAAMQQRLRESDADVDSEDVELVDSSLDGSPSRTASASNVFGHSEDRQGLTRAALVRYSQVATPGIPQERAVADSAPMRSPGRDRRRIPAADDLSINVSRNVAAPADALTSPAHSPQRQRSSSAVELELHSDQRSELMATRQAALHESDDSSLDSDEGAEPVDLDMHDSLQARLPVPQVIPFSEDDMAIVESIAASAGVTLHKAILFSEINRARRKTDALFQIVQATSRESHFYVLLEKIVNALNHAVQADRLSLFIVNSVTSNLWCAVSTEDAIVNKSFSGRIGMVGKCATSGEIVQLSNAVDDPRFDSQIDRRLAPRTGNTVGLLCVPVKDLGNRVVAVVQALNKRLHSVSGREALRSRHSERTITVTDSRFGSWRSTGGSSFRTEATAYSVATRMHPSPAEPTASSSGEHVSGRVQVNRAATASPITSSTLQAVQERPGSAQAGVAKSVPAMDLEAIGQQRVPPRTVSFKLTSAGGSKVVTPLDTPESPLAFEFPPTSHPTDSPPSTDILPTFGSSDGSVQPSVSAAPGTVRRPLDAKQSDTSAEESPLFSPRDGTPQVTDPEAIPSDLPTLPSPASHVDAARASFRNHKSLSFAIRSATSKESNLYGAFDSDDRDLLLACSHEIALALRRKSMEIALFQERGEKMGSSVLHGTNEHPQAHTSEGTESGSERPNSAADSHGYPESTGGRESATPAEVYPIHTPTVASNRRRADSKRQKALGKGRARKFSQDMAMASFLQMYTRETITANNARSRRTSHFPHAVARLYHHGPQSAMLNGKSPQALRYHFRHTTYDASNQAPLKPDGSPALEPQSSPRTARRSSDFGLSSSHFFPRTVSDESPFESGPNSARSHSSHLSRRTTPASTGTHAWSIPEEQGDVSDGSSNSPRARSKRKQDVKSTGSFADLVLQVTALPAERKAELARATNETTESADPAADSQAAGQLMLAGVRKGSVEADGASTTTTADSDDEFYAARSMSRGTTRVRSCSDPVPYLPMGFTNTIGLGTGGSSGGFGVKLPDTVEEASNSSASSSRMGSAVSNASASTSASGPADVGSEAPDAIFMPTESLALSDAAVARPVVITDGPQNLSSSATAGFPTPRDSGGMSERSLGSTMNGTVVDTEAESIQHDTPSSTVQRHGVDLTSEALEQGRRAPVTRGDTDHDRWITRHALTLHPVAVHPSTDRSAGIRSTSPSVASTTGASVSMRTINGVSPSVDGKQSQLSRLSSNVSSLQGRDSCRSFTSTHSSVRSRRGSSPSVMQSPDGAITLGGLGSASALLLPEERHRLFSASSVSKLKELKQLSQPESESPRRRSHGMFDVASRTDMSPPVAAPAPAQALRPSLSFTLSRVPRVASPAMGGDGQSVVSNQSSHLSYYERQLSSKSRRHRRGRHHGGVYRHHSFSGATGVTRARTIRERESGSRSGSGSNSRSASGSGSAASGRGSGASSGGHSGHSLSHGNLLQGSSHQGSLLQRTSSMLSVSTAYSEASVHEFEDTLHFDDIGASHVDSDRQESQSDSDGVDAYIADDEKKPEPVLQQQERRQDAFMAERRAYAKAAQAQLRAESAPITGKPTVSTSNGPQVVHNDPRPPAYMAAVAQRQHQTAIEHPLRRSLTSCPSDGPLHISPAVCMTASPDTPGSKSGMKLPRVQTAVDQIRRSQRRKSKRSLKLRLTDDVRNDRTPRHAARKPVVLEGELEAMLDGGTRDMDEDALLHLPGRKTVDASLAPVSDDDAASECSVLQANASPRLLDGIRFEMGLPVMNPEVWRVWGFDVFELSELERISVVLGILQDTHVFEEFSLDYGQLCRFTQAVEHKYRTTNPFHTFLHGLDVLQSTAFLLNQTGGDEVLSSLEVLGILIGALCHDIDHPGVTNAFLIASDNDLALLYNDMSVLEHHHAATTFTVLRDKHNSTDILDHLSAEELRQLRLVIISGILATDMSKHFEQIEKLKRLPRPPAARAGAALSTTPSTDSGSKHPSGDGGAAQAFDPSSDASRKFYFESILHAADVSGQLNPWPVAEKWGQRIIDEFRNQSSLEKEMGLPLTPHMANLEAKYDQAKMQRGFLMVVLLPFWQELAELFPLLCPLVEHLLSNADRYADTMEASDSPIHTNSGNTP